MYCRGGNTILYLSLDMHSLTIIILIFSISHYFYNQYHQHHQYYYQYYYPLDEHVDRDPVLIVMFMLFGVLHTLDDIALLAREYVTV